MGVYFNYYFILAIFPNQLNIILSQLIVIGQNVGPLINQTFKNTSLLDFSINTNNWNQTQSNIINYLKDLSILMIMHIKIYDFSDSGQVSNNSKLAIIIPITLFLIFCIVILLFYINRRKKPLTKIEIDEFYKY